MRRNTLRNVFLTSLLAIGTLAANPGPAEANRPFLTDDARVVGQGGIEVIWQTFLAVDDGVNAATEATLTFGIIDPLEVALTLGVADEEDGFELAPPVLEAKALFLDPEADAPIGLGVLGGVGLPIGDDESTVLFGTVPVTLMRGPIEVHANVSVATAVGGALDGEARPTFGLGCTQEVP